LFGARFAIQPHLGQCHQLRGHFGIGKTAGFCISEEIVVRHRTAGMPARQINVPYGVQSIGFGTVSGRQQQPPSNDDPTAAFHSVSPAGEALLKRTSHSREGEAMVLSVW